MIVKVSRIPYTQAYHELGSDAYYRLMSSRAAVPFDETESARYLVLNQLDNIGVSVVALRP